MAIKVQEVTLRIVYDDAELRDTPAEWGWERTLKVGHANVGHSFSVAAVTAAEVQAASEAEISEFAER